MEVKFDDVWTGQEGGYFTRSKSSRHAANFGLQSSQYGETKRTVSDMGRRDQNAQGRFFVTAEISSRQPTNFGMQAPTFGDAGAFNSDMASISEMSTGRRNNAVESSRKFTREQRSSEFCTAPSNNLFSQKSTLIYTSRPQNGTLGCVPGSY